MLSLRSNWNQTRQPTNSCLASLATCQTVHVLSILTVEFFFCAVTAALHACVGPSVYCVMYHFDLPTHAKCKNQIQPGPTIETILLSSRSNCKVHTMKRLIVDSFIQTLPFYKIISSFMRNMKKNIKKEPNFHFTCSKQHLREDVQCVFCLGSNTQS